MPRPPIKIISKTVLHRYLLPDGTLGGSKLPDPKALYENGVLYVAPPRKPPTKGRKRRGKRRRR